MNILKLKSYLSGILELGRYEIRNTLYVEPDLMKFFSRTLSRAGSNSSPTSSIKMGLPSDKASSKCVRKYL